MVMPDLPETDAGSRFHLDDGDREEGPNNSQQEIGRSTKDNLLTRAIRYTQQWHHHDPPKEIPTVIIGYRPINKPSLPQV